MVVGQAAKPLFVMSRGDQIRNGVAWDSCEGGKIPEGICTKMTSLTPGGLGDSLATGLMWTSQMNLEAIVYGFLVTNVISCVVSDKIFLKTTCEVV